MCLSVLPPSLLTSLFFFFQGGPPRVFVSLAQHCHSGTGSMSSWNHPRSSRSVFFFFFSFSLPSLTCSLILYRIFVCHPYSCQPLFSPRESITLDCQLVCQSSCGLSFHSFLSRGLSSSMTCHLPTNCKTSGSPVFSKSPSNNFPFYHWGAYT